MAGEHDKALLDRVAEAIYHAHCGINCDGYRAAHGAPCKRWRTDAPWDSNPDELCEHERDDYRAEAQAAIDAFLAARQPQAEPSDAETLARQVEPADPALAAQIRRDVGPPPALRGYPYQPCPKCGQQVAFEGPVCAGCFTNLSPITPPAPQRFWRVVDCGGGGFWACIRGRASLVLGWASPCGRATRAEAEADGRASGLPELRRD